MAPSMSGEDSKQIGGTRSRRERERGRGNISRKLGSYWNSHEKHSRLRVSQVSCPSYWSQVLVTPDTDIFTSLQRSPGPDVRVSLAGCWVWCWQYISRSIVWIIVSVCNLLSVIIPSHSLRVITTQTRQPRYWAWDLHYTHENTDPRMTTLNWLDNDKPFILAVWFVTDKK